MGSGKFMLNQLFPLSSPPGIDFGRRRLLALGGAVAAMSSGCTSMSLGPKAKVVVIGGGWGGLGAARALMASERVNVTLVEPSLAFMSCPLSGHFVTGHRPAVDFTFNYRKVDAAGIVRVPERVIEVDRANKIVVTGTQKLHYDFLVMSPGVEYMEESVMGYAQARDHLPVGFRAFEQHAVLAQVDRFVKEGGTFVITVPKPPYRCPPAPYERAMLIAEQMKKHKTKGKILLLDANSEPFPSPIASPILNAMSSLYADEIEYRPQVDVTAVDIGKKTFSTSQGEVVFGQANLILPMKASSLVRSAALGDRWADVHLPSFQAKADANVYVIGDSHGSPLPKSGHLAFGAGRQVAEHIVRRVRGMSDPVESGPVALPQGICWAAVTQHTAININVSSTVESGQPPKLSFSVDTEHNAGSGSASLSWGHGMWRAMLG